MANDDKPFRPRRLNPAGRIGGTRPKHAARARCEVVKGCKGFARRHSNPPACTEHGGGTRAEKKHRPDGTASSRAVVSVGPKVKALLDGTIDVEDLDDEELAHGYPRSVDGSFRGRPKVIPTALHARMRKELFERADRRLSQDLVNIAEFMAKLALNTEIDPKTRLEAGKYVFERVMGKTPSTVQITADAPFMELLQDIQRGPRTTVAPTQFEKQKALPAGQPDIIDAEIVEDERY